TPKPRREYPPKVTRRKLGLSSCTAATVTSNARVIGWVGGWLLTPEGVWRTRDWLMSAAVPPVALPAVALLLTAIMGPTPGLLFLILGTRRSAGRAGRSTACRKWGRAAPASP